MKKGNKTKGITINLSNKLFYTIIVSVFIIIAGVAVLAYGGTTPNVMGHTLGEIAPPGGCSDDNSLIWNGISWECYPNSQQYLNIVAALNACQNGESLIWDGSIWTCGESMPSGAWCGISNAQIAFIACNGVHPKDGCPSGYQRTWMPDSTWNVCIKE